MLRGKIYQPDYTPHFSGHETFPLRYGWLKKAVDAVLAPDIPSDIFFSDEAIAHFGVGRNMVNSIKFWALATGVLVQENLRSEFKLGPLGHELFRPEGVDPYMEHPSTLWALHWNLCSQPKRTTWHWVFSYLSHPVFEREQVVERLLAVALERGWSRVSKGTVKRDVECFLRTYNAKPASGDDALESPLVELGLVQSVGRRDGFRLNIGPKPSLDDGVFAYAVGSFWRATSDANSMSFESLAYDPGSPGRVFRLEEDDLIERLAGLSETTDGAMAWSETAGLKQLTRRGELEERDELDFLRMDYPPAEARSAA
ncbi:MULTISPECIES: DUF4007 family protein [Alphaproteobacteria]|uniref:DUF4007 family protein n=1 Tax=Alphaproteobacteria TaxID=28211 RepID=UPI0032970136